MGGYDFGGGVSNLMGRHPNRQFNQAQAEPRPYGIGSQPQLGDPPMGQPGLAPAGVGNIAGGGFGNGMPANAGFTNALPQVGGQPPFGSPSPYTNGGNQVGGPMPPPASPSPYTNGGNQVFGGGHHGGGFGDGTALGDLMSGYGGGRRPQPFGWGQDR